MRDLFMANIYFFCFVFSTFPKSRYYVSALQVAAYTGPYDNVETGRPAQWVPPYTPTIPPSCSFAGALTEDFPATPK